MRGTGFSSTLTPGNQVAVVLLGLIVFLVAGVNVGVRVWAWLFNVQGLPRHPFKLVAALARGDITVDTVGSVFAFGGVLFLVLLVIGFSLWRFKPGLRGDKAARLTGRSSDTQILNEASVRDKARRLNVAGDFIGLPIAKTLHQVRNLFSSWEDVALLLAGPRTGKTTSWVVPRILAAPGAVIATSNKRDILDSTRFVREDANHRSWVFDPQNIGGVTQEWWWNPLSYVRGIEEAQDLAGVFDTAIHNANDSKSAFFDTEGKDTIACLLLAAAKANYPITKLVYWLGHTNDDEPIEILKRDPDSCRSAERLEGIYQLPGETRGGVIGSANQLVSFLTNPNIIKWITPPSTGFIPHFDTASFVRSTDTLYLLSQEGKGNASAIVTALTVAVIDEAKTLSETNGGRVPQPIYVCLDEAANVCKWADLPNMYSHFGSRGIVVDTILQSWSQGIEVWGENGMQKLWSAANVKVYAGGVHETKFLQILSELIGDHYVDSRNVSSGKHGRSVSIGHESTQRRIASVSDLASLPAGRAWVLGSTAKPVLCQLQPWYKTTLKPLVENSIKRSQAGTLL